MLFPGDVLRAELTTHNVAGARSDADELPTGVLVRNNVDTLELVQVTKKPEAIGVYSLAAAIPTNWSRGDTVAIRATASVDEVVAQIVVAFSQLAGLSAGVIAAVADGVYAAGRAFPAANLANAPTATSVVTVLPYTGTAAGTGELSSHQFTAYQHAATTFVLGVYDADDNPVDLSERDLAWVAFDPNDPTTAVLTVKNYDDETAIVITGESNNTAQVSLSAVDMASAANLAWILRDATNDLALMVGKLRIIAVPAIPAIPVAPE